MARIIHKAWRTSAKTHRDTYRNADEPVYPTWLRPSASAQLGCKAKKMPCCVGPLVDADTSLQCVAAAEKYVARGKDPGLFERIVPNAMNHVGLVEGREHVSPLVVGRTTYDLHSGAVISKDRIDDLSQEKMHRPIQGGPKDIRVVFHLKQRPTEAELDEHVPAMPARPCHSGAWTKAAQAAAKAAAHRCKLHKGWVTTNAMVARSVKPAELKWNTDAKKQMQVEIDKLEEREVWDLKGVRPWHEVSAEAKRRQEKPHLGNVFGICVEKGLRTTTETSRP